MDELFDVVLANLHSGAVGRTSVKDSMLCRSPLQQAADSVGEGSPASPRRLSVPGSALPARHFSSNSSTFAPLMLSASPGEAATLARVHTATTGTDKTSVARHSSTNAASHGQISQTTVSSGNSAEDEFYAGMKQDSQRQLIIRLHARLGLRHKSDEVTAEVLHTAMVTLGVEQFELVEMEDFLMELQLAVSQRASTMAAATTGIRKKLHRGQTYEHGGHLPFMRFAHCLIGQKFAPLQMTPKSLSTLTVVREVLLCGDANRLVAQLAQVRVDDLAAPMIKTSWAGKIEPVVGVMIVLNGFLIGVEQDQSIDVSVDGPYFWFDFCFTVFFLLEMLLKMATLGCRAHFWGKDWSWNWFDDIIVLLAVADTFFAVVHQGEFGTSTFTVIRVIRLTRVTRLFRIFQLKQLRELSLMVKGLFAGMRTLFWAIILLFFTIYIFAVLLSALTKLETPDYAIREEKLFHNVPASMFTAFRCFVGDCQDSQGRSISKLMADQYGWTFIVGYLIAMVFVTFGLFNLIFAVYIENTLSAAKVSKSTHVERYKESLRVAHAAKRLLKKFCSAYRAGEEIHKEGTVGKVLRQTTDMELEDVHMKVSKELFLLVIQDPEVQRLMDDLDIPPDRASLFDILDADGSGGLEAAELIQGFLRVRGEARKSDVLASVLAVRASQDMLRELKRTQDQLHESVKRILPLILSSTHLENLPSAEGTQAPERLTSPERLHALPGAAAGGPPARQSPRSRAASGSRNYGPAIPESEDVPEKE